MPYLLVVAPFNHNINLRLEPPCPHGLASVSRVLRRVVILHAKIPIGAYNDVRVEVCINIGTRFSRCTLIEYITSKAFIFPNPQQDLDVWQGPF